MTTRYDALCETYAKTQPHRLKIDRNCRAIPEQMRQAIITDLDAPTGAEPFLSALHNRPVPFVFHVREVPNVENGRTKWVPVFDVEEGDLLVRWGDGVARFALGVALSATNAGASFFYFRFSLEDIQENRVKMLVEHAGENVIVDPSKPDGFADAASKVVDLLSEAIARPDTLADGRGVFGFAAK